MIFLNSSYKSYSIAALFIGCFFLLACNSPKKEKKKIDGSVGIEVAKNVSIQYSIGSRKKAMLTGPIMYRIQDTASFIEFPKKLHVDFYNELDSIESKLDAKYGKYKDKESKVFLKDSVRVINTKGDTLFCDELYWDRARTGMEFYTDKPVRIRTSTQIIDGIGMEAGQDFKEWHIIQPIGFLNVPASDFPN